MLPFYTKRTAQARAQARVGSKLVVFLHPTAESERLSSDSLLPEFRSLALLCVHANHFSNDCAYDSKGLSHVNYFLCIYVACVTESHMVE